MEEKLETEILRVRALYRAGKFIAEYTGECPHSIFDGEWLSENKKLCSSCDDISYECWAEFFTNRYEPELLKKIFIGKEDPK